MNNVIGGLERGVDYWFKVNEAILINTTKSTLARWSAMCDWAAGAAITGTEMFVAIDYVIPPLKEGRYKDAVWTASYIGALELIKYAFQKYLKTAERENETISDSQLKH